MTLRDHITTEQAWAHRILDDVRAGLLIHWATVAKALRVLGEPVDA